MRGRLGNARWQELAPHLDRALELTGEQRLAWLDTVRAEDAALALDLEALLEEHSALEQEGFLEGSPPTPPASAAESTHLDPIGPYRILRELGRGGMGCVYLAEQEGDDFRRLVALKVVEPGGAGVDRERRFRDERRILAGLEHPGIARFYDAGRAPDGRWFLALEYVEGLNLLEHARRRDLPTNERVRLFQAVLDAVEFAHARSVVHRDLKPGNILVGPDGRPRLLDFGIAKLLDPDPDAPATQTNTEFRALTPAYASPEQFRGDAVTPASDVFSLGVVLYELVAGVRPFAPTSTSRAALERAVLSEEPAPPSTASRRAMAATVVGAGPTRPAIPFRSKRVRLSRDLDAICLKALRKEPGQRYASAAAFAEDLVRYLEGRPVAARRDGRRYRMARFARRHRGRLATYGALAVAAASAVVAANAHRPADGARPPDPPAPRIYPFSNVQTPIAELERRFAAAPDSVEAGAALATVLYEEARYQEAQLVVGRLRQIPGREQDPLTDYIEASVATDSTEPQRALVLFTRARDGAIAGGRGDLVGRARAGRGGLLSKMGNRDEALAEFQLARADFERAGDRDSLISVLNDLAIEYLHRGEMEEGEALLEQALAEVRAAGRPGIAIVQNLALVALQRGRPDLAEPRLRELIELHGASPTQGFAEVVQSLAETLNDLGRTAQAAPLLDQSVELMRKAEKQSGLGEALYARGLVDVGQARLERIAETAREMEAAASAAGDKVTLGLAHHLRGRAAAARGDLATARRHLAECSRLLVDSGNLDRASDTDVARAALEHAAADPAAALRLLDGALARLDGGGAGLPVGFFAATLRARIDAESGRTAEARRRLEALGEGSAHSPSLSRRLAFLGARASMARAERRFDDALRDLDAARRAADEAGRRLDSLGLGLDLAEIDLAAGRRRAALAAAEPIRREAAAAGLGGLAMRARRLAGPR